jgi:hypothetical protein
VPAGKVEHTVMFRKVDGTNAVKSNERQERWLTRTSGRVVVRDADSGKVLREVSWTRAGTRIFDAEKNTVEIIRASNEGETPPWNAMSFDAAVQRSYVEQGITRVIGEKTVGGRRALVTESVPGKWVSDEPSSRTTAVVDAETFALYERTTGLPAGEFTQNERYTLTELLDAGSPRAQAAKAFGKHKGAKVKQRRAKK